MQWYKIFAMTWTFALFFPLLCLRGFDTVICGPAVLCQIQLIGWDLENSMSLSIWALWQCPKGSLTRRVGTEPLSSNKTVTVNTQHRQNMSFWEKTVSISGPASELTQTRSNMFGRTWKYHHTFGSNPTGQSRRGSAENVSKIFGFSFFFLFFNQISKTPPLLFSCCHCLVLSVDW